MWGAVAQAIEPATAEGPTTARWNGWWAALLVGLPIAALFGPALLRDESFATRDAGHFYYPLFEWAAREWGAGRLPLWNPLEGGGAAVVADASSSVFYPGKLIFALPVAFALRFNLYVVAHVVLAAAGAFRLARGLACSWQAAVLSAVAYSCGGSVAFQYSNVVFLVSAAWLPWALQALLGMMRTPGWDAALRLGIVLALMVLGGDPQMVVHVGLCAILYLAAQASLGWRSRSEGALADGESRESRMASLLARGGFLAAAMAIAFALSAVQILPAREAARESTRAARGAPRNAYEWAAAKLRPSAGDVGEGRHDARNAASEIFHSSGAASHQNEVYDFSLGPWRAAELVWPNVFGRMFPTHRRWLNELPGEGRIWTPTLYLGLVNSVLGLWQLRLRSNDVAQRWLAWVFLLFALGSLGWYGLGWLVREIYGTLLGGDASRIGLAPPAGGVYWLLVTSVPSYVQFRYPAKLFVVASLALSLLAAKGWDQMLRERSRGLNATLVAIAALSMVGLGASFVGADWFLARAWKADPAFGPFDARGALSDLRWGFLQAAAMAAFALLTVRQTFSRGAPVWANVLLAAVVLDVLVANAWLVATAPAATWSAETILAADQVNDGEKPRLYRVRASNWWPSEFKQAASPVRMAQICDWEHATLVPKHHLLADVQLADTSSSLRSLDRDSFWRVARQLRRGGLVPHENALRLTGTQYLLTPPSVAPAQGERWERLDTPSEFASDVRLWRLLDPLPDAWIVHRVVRLEPLSAPFKASATDERTRQVLLEDGRPRDFSRSAVVETDQPLAELDGPSDELTLAECRVERTSPQQMTIVARLARPGLLVINQAYAPGWVARLKSADGLRTLPVFRTNRIQQGVVLPAGEHTVELAYEPRSFYLGAGISLLAWAAVGVAIAVRLRSYRV